MSSLFPYRLSSVVCAAISSWRLSHSVWQKKMSNTYRYALLLRQKLSKTRCETLKKAYGEDVPSSILASVLQHWSVEIEKHSNSKRPSTSGEDETIEKEHYLLKTDGRIRETYEVGCGEVCATTMDARGLVTAHTAHLVQHPKPTYLNLKRNNLFQDV